MHDLSPGSLRHSLSSSAQVAVPHRPMAYQRSAPTALSSTQRSLPSKQKVVLWGALAVFLSVYFFIFASVVACPQQDGASIGGLCAKQTLAKAQSGDVRSRWVYARHLRLRGDEDGYQIWVRRLALQNQDLTAMREVIQLCRQGASGFTRSDINNWMNEASASPRGVPTSVSAVFSAPMLRKLLNDKASGCPA